MSSDKAMHKVIINVGCSANRLALGGWHFVGKFFLDTAINRADSADIRTGVALFMRGDLGSEPNCSIKMFVEIATNALGTV